MSASDKRILISGRRPGWAPVRLALGTRGLPVVVFDDNSECAERSARRHTHPATLDCSRKVDSRRHGARRPGRADLPVLGSPSGELVAEFDHAILKDETPTPFVVQCEQFKTRSFCWSDCAASPMWRSRSDHEVIDVSQNADSVSIEVRGPTASAATPALI